MPIATSQFQKSPKKQKPRLLFTPTSQSMQAQGEPLHCPTWPQLKMKIDTVIQKLKNRAIAMNMKTGTRIVWHSCWVNSAVVFITMMPIRILRMQHTRITNEMPAITKAVIAMLRIMDGSCPLMTVMLILPSEPSKHTTPKATMAAKQSTMTEMTRHPPQALMKKSRSKDSMRVMKIMESEMGQVVFKSAMLSSQKLSPKSMVSAMTLFVGQHTPTNSIVEQLPQFTHGNSVLFRMHLKDEFVRPDYGHWLMQANWEVFFELKQPKGYPWQPQLYPHCLPEESKGAASKCGCPLEKATTATAISPAQKSRYRMRKNTSRHLRSSSGPWDR